MLKKIDHIGVAVYSLKRASGLYENAFGLASEGIEDVPAQQVRVQKFAIGQTRIELLEPKNEDSPISKFLQKRGEGIHHLAYSVEHLEDVLAVLEKKGLEIIGEPVTGSDGKRIVFIHPKSANGVLIELVEEDTKS
ncbi:MAG: methylmalonyl-CoA epimerase [Calditrichaeota bacterium]|nr:methylmalonyl-CoA epimerase [Calditrichota bacterium]